MARPGPTTHSSQAKAQECSARAQRKVSQSKMSTQQGMSPTGGGRGGRDEDRGLSNSSGGRSSPKSNHSSSGFRKEYKFSTHGYGKKSQQKATYNQVLDALCTEIVRNYDDGDLIEETLRTENLATLQMPTKKFHKKIMRPRNKRNKMPSTKFIKRKSGRSCNAKST